WKKQEMLHRQSGRRKLNETNLRVLLQFSWLHLVKRQSRGKRSEKANCSIYREKCSRPLISATQTACRNGCPPARKVALDPTLMRFASLPDVRALKSQR